MDHGGKAARPTMVESTDLGMAGAVVQGDEANIGRGAFDGQLAAPPGSFSDFHLREAPVAAGFWRRQLGPVHVALLGLQQLPADDGVVQVHGNYGYSALQPRPGAGRGEVIRGPLPDGVGVVFDNSSNFVPQTLLGIGGADGITGALHDPNLGAGYGNRGMVAEHLRRLLPLAIIGACSVAVNGLAAGPGSPAVAFDLFLLLLGGLFLVIVHVLRV